MNRRKFLKAAAIVTGSAFLGAGFKVSTAKAKEQKKMKILVLTGSPRKNGNSNTLADNFIKGAAEAGHEIVRFDAAQKTFIRALPAITAEWTVPACLKTILNSSGSILWTQIWLFLLLRCTISAFRPS